MKHSQAEILREYGPFPGVERVHGVTYDGQHVWFASGERINALDPAAGKVVRSIDVPADAGTAFDGKYIYQIAEDRIQKIDPETGEVVATIPAPGNGGDSGLAWAEDTLWVGQHRGRKIYQIDPESGAILRTIESNRFVTGVTWWTVSFGTAPGKATIAMSGASIRRREKSCNASTCRRARACQASSPMGKIGFSAAMAVKAR